MRARISLVIALVVGLVAGGVGVWALCNEGYCGDDSTPSGQASATRTAAEFGAASPWAEPTSTMPGAIIPATKTTASESSASKEIEQITGLAIISDSTADEYRADNPRGGEFGETTFNWVELLAVRNRINLGEWDDNRPEPRRGGYAYNWARSGATSATMIESGQHTGVAEQIQAGEVSHVIIQIGINDFYWDDVSINIYNDQLSGDELQEFLDGIIANVDLAVQTVKGAGDSRIMLAALPDYLTPGVLPGVSEVFPDPAGWQRIVDAFGYVNQGYSEVAAREDIPFFDFNAELQRELKHRFDPDDPRFILVGGERIDLSARGNEPHHLFVDDEFAHPGTVFSGLIANLFIEQMNANFGTAVAPFSDDEILSIAGIE